mmetsp:Transcript_2350/g.9210  ORF Transcript_2350/g.9210 Transcript_2350/m.9210 type:complete len:284 (+) Transcript_2350:1553-2404(+)
MSTLLEWVWCCAALLGSAEAAVLSRQLVRRSVPTAFGSRPQPRTTTLSAACQSLAACLDPQPPSASARLPASEVLNAVPCCGAVCPGGPATAAARCCGRERRAAARECLAQDSLPVALVEHAQARHEEAPVVHSRVDGGGHHADGAALNLAQLVGHVGRHGQGDNDDAPRVHAPLGEGLDEVLTAVVVVHHRHQHQHKVPLGEVRGKAGRVRNGLGRVVAGHLADLNVAHGAAERLREDGRVVLGHHGHHRAREEGHRARVAVALRRRYRHLVRVHRCQRQLE